MSDQGNEEEDEDRVIYHPNREKAASQATKAIVVLLLVVTAVLTLLITAGGWSQLQGAQIVSIGFIIVFPVMAYYVWKWQRGVLPLAAGLAIILGVFAAIAAFGAGSWSDRSDKGYAAAALPADLIWLLCIVLIPVLVLLIIFAMRAFSQKWNIEIEMSREEFENEYRDGDGGAGRGGGYGQAQPAGG
jgi:lysylphosphatidylglycerol synthetase-like protein (DUF2156 family)